MEITIKKQIECIKNLLDSNVISRVEYDDLNKFLSSILSKGSTIKEESTNRDIEIKSQLNKSSQDSSEIKNNSKESSDKHISDNTQKAANKGKSKILIIIASILVFLLVVVTAYYFYTEKLHSDELLIEQREKVKADSTLLAEKARQDSIAAAETIAAKNAELAIMESEAINQAEIEKEELMNSSLSIIKNYYSDINSENFDANNWFNEVVQTYKIGRAHV